MQNPENEAQNTNRMQQKIRSLHGCESKSVTGLFLSSNSAVVFIAKSIFQATLVCPIFSLRKLHYKAAQTPRKSCI